MRNIIIGANLLLCALCISCNNTESEIVGSWKRTEFLDTGDEPKDDGIKGYILDLNEDNSFSLRYSYKTGRIFDRNKEGTWALTSPIEKEDQAALVLRFKDYKSITEETHRLRAVGPDGMRLIFDGETSVFQRR